MNILEPFETYRPLLFSIAYRMLGSAMEAEDMVQETFLRYQAASPDSIQSPRAWLMTVITRLCLNDLESARVQRESYIGPWLPEPIFTGEGTRLEALDQASLNESVSIAFLVLLETLTPLERAVFLLREVFEYEYAEIAEIVGKSEVECRQLLSRGKKHVAERRPRFRPNPEQHRRVLERFSQAATGGEMAGLMDLLAEDVTLWADGGGKARGAALRPLHGRDAVARFLLAAAHLPDQPFQRELSEVNGEPAIILRTDGRAFLAAFITLSGEKIKEVRLIGNPDKLQRL